MHLCRAPESKLWYTVLRPAYSISSFRLVHLKFRLNHAPLPFDSKASRPLQSYSTTLYSTTSSSGQAAQNLLPIEALIEIAGVINTLASLSSNLKLFEGR